MKKIYENGIVAFVALIHFVFIVDFMMVAPLGPDYVSALGAENSDIGRVVASYTLAAAFSSLLLAKFLDRFDRRNVIVIFLLGLSVTTILCAFSENIEQLILFRFIAGLFGGPAATMGIAIVIDRVPEKRRGKAMGRVMSAFSISSIIGIPIALELSNQGGWQMPFFVVGGFIFIVAICFLFVFPPMKEHFVHQNEKQSRFLSLFFRKEALVTYLMTITAMLSAFLIIPNIAAYMQFNLAFPRDDYSLLYFAGGVVSLVVMQLSGRNIDKCGMNLLGVLSTVLIIAIVYTGFVAQPVILPAVGIFIGYMAAMSMRNVVSVSLSSMVPNDHERAAFTSLNQSVSHFAAALGALIGSYFLTVDEKGLLIGMDTLGLSAIGLSLFLPVCVYFLYGFVRRRQGVIGS